MKIARCWGYNSKKVPSNRATVLFAENNFWGRSLAAISTSSDFEVYADFGPYMPRFEIVPYDDLHALEHTLRKNPDICAYMMEAIQGEAGVVIPKVE